MLFKVARAAPFETKNRRWLRVASGGRGDIRR